MIADYPGQTDLLTTFWRLAHWTWHRRATAKKAGMPFSEESVTESLLLDLATQNTSDVLVVPFNKWKEGQTGADWEWCFHDPQTATFQRMLVQAKLLDDKETGYSHIDRYIGNTGVRQIDRLLETSKKYRIPAIYVFYNHFTSIKPLPSHSSNCQACHKCWGCSFASADAVSALMQSGKSAIACKSFTEIKTLSKPWICLLCDCQSKKAPLPQRALRSLQELRGQLKTSIDTAGLDFKGLELPEVPSTEPPEYFGRLLELRSTEEPLARSEMIEKIGNDLPGIDGIVIVTENSRLRLDR